MEVAWENRMDQEEGREEEKGGGRRFTVGGVESTLELAKRRLTCPTSSKAMMMTAAPKRRIVLAFSRKSSSPSLRLMELTMHLPWVHFSPASMMAKLEESIHKGTCRG